MSFAEIYGSVLKEFPDVMTPEDTASALGISSKTVYRLLQANIIGHIKMGRTYKIPKIHLLTYLQLIDQESAPA